jgi:hypothetical protein
MDVHVPTPAEIAQLAVQFPVILVLLGGIVFGSGLTQLIKRTYLAWQPLSDKPVSKERYRASLRWLAALSTYAFTMGLWHTMLEHTGAEEVVSIGTAFCSPLVYDCGRALIAWKFPGFGHHLNKDGDEP